jgi:aldehyde dehydrogenase (NAD+)
VTNGHCANGVLRRTDRVHRRGSGYAYSKRGDLRGSAGRLTVSDLEEAIYNANSVDYGLSASIVTDDNSDVNRFIDAVDAGVPKINEKTTGLELHVPFGGAKRSSSETYKEQGEDGIEFYTKIKTVYDNY